MPSGIAATPPNIAQVTYDVTDNGDGTLTILSLPILGHLEKRARGNLDEIGEDWMRGCLSAHTAQLLSGFAAPVHAGHHSFDGKDDCPALGTFVPVAVSRMSFDGGEARPVLLADMTVTAEAFDEIRAGKYPYRSVEACWDDGRIASLALLSGQAPHFPFPMLKSLRLLSAPAATLSVRFPVTSPRVPGFALLSARTRDAALARLAAYAKAESDEGEEEAPPPDSHAEPDGDEPTSGKGPDSGVAKALAGMSELLARIYEAIVGKDTEDRVQPARDEDPKTSGEPTAPDKDDPAEGKPAAKEHMMSKDTQTLDAAANAKIAKLETDRDSLASKVTSLETERNSLASKVAALETRLAAADLATAVQKATAQLRAARVVIPAKFEERFTALHQKDAALAADFVATLVESGRKDPPETFVDALGANAMNAQAADDALLAPYAQKDAAALSKARESLAAYRAYAARVPDTTQTAASWLKTNCPL